MSEQPIRLTFTFHYVQPRPSHPLGDAVIREEKTGLTSGCSRTEALSAMERFLGEHALTHKGEVHACTAIDGTFSFAEPVSFAAKIKYLACV